MSDEWHGGKGDKPRPVDKKKYDEEFDRIFGKVAKEFVEKVVEETHEFDENGECKICTEKFGPSMTQEEIKEYMDNPPLWEDKNEDEPYDIQVHVPKHAKEYYQDSNEEDECNRFIELSKAIYSYDGWTKEAALKAFKNIDANQETIDFVSGKYLDSSSPSKTE